MNGGNPSLLFGGLNFYNTAPHGMLGIYCFAATVAPLFFLGKNASKIGLEMFVVLILSGPVIIALTGAPHHFFLYIPWILSLANVVNVFFEYNDCIANKVEIA